MQIGQGDLGGPYQPHIIFHIVVDILFEFWELPCAPHTLLAHDGRRVHFDIAMLLRVEIQHPVDQTALETCPQTKEYIKPAAGELNAALEIDDP